MKKKQKLCCDVPHKYVVTLFYELKEIGFCIIFICKIVLNAEKTNETKAHVYTGSVFSTHWSLKMSMVSSRTRLCASADNLLRSHGRRISHEHHGKAIERKMIAHILSAFLLTSVHTPYSVGPQQMCKYVVRKNTTCMGSKTPNAHRWSDKVTSKNIHSGSTLGICSQDHLFLKCFLLPNLKKTILHPICK